VKPRNILIVTYYYPPLNSIGARRPHALAKWLGRRGHDVTVLSSVQSGPALDDAPARVIRTRDLLSSRLNWRKDIAAVASGRIDAPWDPSPGFWGSLVVPDIQLVSWIPFAIATALRTHREVGFDVVISTSPVESAHLVGAALQRRCVPWVADLRDGWRFEPARPEWPFPLQRRLDTLFERETLARADEIVTVTDPLSEDLRARLGLGVTTITNGFDPDLVVNNDARSYADPAKLTLVYTGRLGPKQSLVPLLEALARIARYDRTASERIELLLAGPRTAEQERIYGRQDFEPFIRYLGYVSHSVALSIQREADVLVLAASRSRHGEATGKLYEYLAARRPILLLGTGNAAAEIVESCGAGVAIATDDIDAAEAVVRRALAGNLSTPPESAGDAYAYPVIAERYERLIELVIGRRA
jgi:glycosyltransferase involved in cell wall biosynthesis